MTIDISPDKAELGRRAAERGAAIIRETIEKNGSARVIVATGASQFEMINELVQAPGIDWSKVTAFHLDEYVGVPESHPASFRKYLRERFVARLPQPPAEFYAISGEGDCAAECARLDKLIKEAPIDLAFVGIGENGHLAFNDPPADFEVEDAYLVVDLDDDCRRQQLGEGWFPSFEDVPKQAISMSIKQIMASRAIIASVPDKRKAAAVQKSLEGEISPLAPSSILQNHPATWIYLDSESASLLKDKA